MMSLLVASCGGSSSRDKDRIAELEAEIAELKSSNITTSTTNEETNYVSSTSSTISQNGQSIVGTYELTDALNRQWLLSLKDDETVELSIKGTDTSFYGSWSAREEGTWLEFGYKENPIVFPNGNKGFIGHGLITNGYLYSSLSEGKAKNPKQRLSIRKIK